jgi:formylglycine-generating enzyme
MQTTPWIGKSNSEDGDDYPATYLDWADATEFCKKLTEIERRAGLLQPGSKYTLPTEAQWEYACRAGTTTRYSFGDDEEDLPAHGWFKRNAIDVGQKYPHQVGRKKSNAWGLFDMHGNVWEWCRDAYQEKLPGGTDPEVSTESLVRVNRSGCWGNPGGSCRSASRYGREMSESRRDSLGFRIACTSSE